MTQCRICKAMIDREIVGFCPDCWEQPFPITTVCRFDLQKFLSIEQIAAIDMAELADKMSDAYCDMDFWIDLEILAREAAQEAAQR